MELPNELVRALEDESVKTHFDDLQPDVRANFAWWVEHAESDELRRRRIDRIIVAVKSIQEELNRH